MPPLPDAEPTVSRYLDYLPAIYSEDGDPGKGSFLGRFLLAFEHVLTGREDPADPGLEEVLDGIDGGRELRGAERHFDPTPPPDAAGDLELQQAPAEFLDWLAQWVALSLRADMPQARQRALIANAVSLYKRRGTKQGLEDVIALATGTGVTIEEQADAFQIGVHSRIGVDTLLGGGPPHFFRVVATFPTRADADASEAILREILDAEKPAHTYYRLDLETPVLQIGVTSTVGVDTVLAPKT
jgi:phage tail-like protein